MRYIHVKEKAQALGSGDSIEIVAPGEPFPRRRVRPVWRDGTVVVEPDENLISYCLRAINWVARTDVGGPTIFVKPRRMKKRTMTRVIAITPGPQMGREWDPVIHTEAGTFGQSRHPFL